MRCRDLPLVAHAHFVFLFLRLFVPLLFLSFLVFFLSFRLKDYIRFPREGNMTTKERNKFLIQAQAKVRKWYRRCDKITRQCFIFPLFFYFITNIILFPLLNIEGKKIPKQGNEPLANKNLFHSFCHFFPPVIYFSLGFYYLKWNAIIES